MCEGLPSKQATVHIRLHQSSYVLCPYTWPYMTVYTIHVKDIVYGYIRPCICRILYTVAVSIIIYTISFTCYIRLDTATYTVAVGRGAAALPGQPSKACTFVTRKPIIYVFHRHICCDRIHGRHIRLHQPSYML